MMIDERREEILNLLREHGKVQVSDLTRRFKISGVTIRNDLKELHERGLVRKTHGGAILSKADTSERPLQERYDSHANEKRRIGDAAARLVNDGETIILDSGTTTQEIAKRIKEKKDLTVITNGVNVAMELVGVTGIRVILLGGILREDAFSVVGYFAEEMLKNLSADRLFLATDACDLEFGISTSNLDESHVNQAMARVARDKVLVTDSSKFGRRGLSRIASLFEMDAVITDTRLPEGYQVALRGQGVELILV